MIFTNVLIHFGGASKEFDALIFTPIGGYAVDLKAWHGTIREEADGSWSAHGEIRENALRSMSLSTRPVYSKLKEIPELRHYHLRELVIFTQSTPDQLQFPPEKRESILTLKEAYSHIHDGVGLDKERARRQPLEWLEKTVQRHLNLQPADRSNLLERNWRIKQRVERRGWTECEVEHPELGIARAKLFPFPPALSDKARLEYKEKVRRELNALLALQRDDYLSPHVEHVRAANPTDDYYYVILDKPKGLPLADWLKRKPSKDERTRLALELAGVLAKIHTKGVTHRNLEPDAVYVAESRRVILRNFDFSKPTHEGRSGLSEKLPAVAHPEYVAPEVLQDPRLADQTADVFSLGKLLLTILESAQSETLASILGPATSPDRTQRPRNAAELATALDQAVHAEELAKKGEIAVGGSVSNGRFEILEKLGEGGFCPVFLARDTARTNRPLVALKVYPATTTERVMLENEIDILEVLHHKHIVKVRGLFTHADKLLLALEYVKGRPLRQYFDENGLPRRELAGPLAVQLLEAVAYLEAQTPHVFHRDISARNILLTGTGTSDDPFLIKLIDFGLASFTSTEGGQIGTRTYRAPEADRGVAQWTIQHELYSIGVLLFELLTGRLPYKVEQVSTDGQSAPTTIARKDLPAQVLPEERTEIQALGLERVLDAAERACSFDPASRPRSAREMLIMIEPPATPPPSVVLIPTSAASTTEDTSWITPAEGVAEGLPPSAEANAVMAAPEQPMVVAPPATSASEAILQPASSSGPASAGKVILARYQGRPPTSAQIHQSLNLPKRFHYLTATKAQSRLRDASPELAEGLLDQLLPDRPDPPLEGRPDAPRHALVFRDFFTQQLQKADVAILPRSLEQTLLERAARILVQDDPAAARRLQQDVESWRRALEKVEECGALNPGELTDELSSQLVHPALKPQLSKLHEIYTQLQDEEQAYSWPRAASRHIDKHYQAPPVVIMEGFTRLTDLQRRFILRCRAQGSIVYLIHPYVSAQKVAFEALDNLWPDPDGHIEVESEPLLQTSRLEKLQQKLWATGAESAAASDKSLDLEEYPHRHREVLATIERIRTYLKADETGVAPYQPSDIAVITRDTELFQAMLAEESERETLPFRFDASARLLLLTPPGRFILALYNVWKDGHLEMTDNHFGDILASGFAGPVQLRMSAYDAVRAQYFANAHSYHEWTVRLAKLREVAGNPDAQRDLKRLPSTRITPETVDEWKAALDLVNALAGRLFAAEGRTIREHVEALLDELSAFAPVEMMKTQRAMLTRIQEVLVELEQSGVRVAISAPEFAQMVHRLIADGDEKDDAGPGGDKSGSIWLTTPEGIDGYSKRVVFYLSLDTLSAPSNYIDPWPFAPATREQHQTAVDSHRAKERYAFLAVVRAARDRLHLSYARLDADHEYRPSIFLREAAATLGETLVKIPLEGTTAAQPVPSHVEVGTVRVKELTFGSVAHYMLCPYRFLMERTNSEAATYRSRFQLRIAAKGVWLRLLLDHVRTQPPTASSFIDVLTDSAIETYPEMQKIFPGFREYDWEQVKAELFSTLRHYATRAAGPSEVAPIAATTHAHLVHDTDRVAVHYPRIDSLRAYPVNDAELHLEWLLPTPRTLDDAQKPTPPGDTLRGTTGFEEKPDALTWWEYHLRARAASPEVRAALELATSGKYPKNAGDHCKLCPAYSECLGRQ